MVKFFLLLFYILSILSLNLRPFTLTIMRVATGLYPVIIEFKIFQCIVKISPSLTDVYKNQ